MLQPTPSSEEPFAPRKKPTSETPKPEPQPVPQTYTFREVYEASLQYFAEAMPVAGMGGDPFAADTFASKYALQMKKDVYVELTPDDMHRRLARAFARVEQRYENPMTEDEIYGLFKNFRYVVPQGSPMSAVGNPYKLQSASNCFVIPSPEDSYGGILWTDQEQAQIMKRRGGVGFDISTIRPRGLPTNNAAVTTDGIGIFMQRYSNTTSEVAQGGRRGALMLTIDVHHPEIRTFIEIKNQLTHCKKCGHGERSKVTKANCSVRVSDDFLEAVEKGEQYQLRWPVDAEKPTIEEWVDAREIWDLIIESAHNSGEPGMLLWGNAKKYTPADIYADEGFASTSTNPCGEIILSPYDSCRLMAINLTGFVDHAFTPQAAFNWTRFSDVVQKAQRLMDDLVDLEIEQVDKILAKIEADPESDKSKVVELLQWKHIRDAAVKGRRTGLGIVGLGDAIAMTNSRYGSTAANDLTEEIYRKMAANSYTASIKMAEERGAFPVCDVEKETGHPFIERIKEQLDPEVLETYRKFGRRNIANTTTAPTGSVAGMTQTTNGIEPAFALTYLRRRRVNPEDPNIRVDSVDDEGESWMHFNMLHRPFALWCEATGRNVEAALERLNRKDASGSLDPDLSDVMESPYWGGMANDVDWEAKLDAQGRAQRWVDHAISNTTNMPAGTPIEATKKVYLRAWKAGCKGVTVYVEGSRDGVLLREEESESGFVEHDAPKRPERLDCDLYRSKVKDANGEYTDWLILVGLLDDKPYEIFGGVSETFGIPKKIKEGWIVKRSRAKKDGGGGIYDLYYGDPEDPHCIRDIAKTFDDHNLGMWTRMVSGSLRHGMRPSHVVEQLGRDKDSDMMTFGKALARALKKYIPDGTEVRTTKVCSECGAENALVYQEGCMSCTACAWRKCG